MVINKRLPNLDLLKVVSIYAVILLHALPIMSIKNQLDVVIVNLSRFAVPCFFILSGFFVGEKASSSYVYFFFLVKKVFIVFLFWNFFYLIIPTDFSEIQQVGYLKYKYWIAYQLISHPYTVITQGLYGHLWFLNSLLCAYTYLYFVSKLDKKWVIYFALVFYVVNLLGGGYSQTDLGFSLPFTSRNGPFVSSLFFSIGWYFSQYTVSLSRLAILLMVICGGIGHILEYYYLNKNYPGAVHYEFLLFTPLFSAGVFMFFLKLKVSESVTILGKYSLGIYVLHVLVLDYMSFFIKEFHLELSWVTFIGYTIFCYFVSLWLSVFLSKIDFFRKFVV